MEELKQKAESLADKIISQNTEISRILKQYGTYQIPWDEFNTRNSNPNDKCNKDSDLCSQVTYICLFVLMIHIKLNVIDTGHEY